MCLGTCLGTCLGVSGLSIAGKNDGAVQGKRYFTVEPGRGLFVRPMWVVKRTS